jgi:hypothetical protein
MLRLCNPVDKNGETPGAETGTDHLLTYNTVPTRSTPVRGIVVANQFGRLTVDALSLQRLMVPTAKSLTASPPPPSSATGSFIDHFDCYRIKLSHGTPRFTPRSVTLVDQFGSATVTVSRPKFLCNPVSKNGETPGAEHDLMHLLCYPTKHPGSTGFSNTQLFVNNQFGPRTISVDRRDELCLPTVKNPPSTTTSTTTTTTTTTTTLPPLCCEVPPGSGLANPVPVCFVAVPDDVLMDKCQLLGGVVTDGVCDPELEQCVPSPPVPPSDFCCECPVPSPPFPHDQVCFEGTSGNEFNCEPPCVLVSGKTCGPMSERCGGSPSGAFLDATDADR